MSNSDDPVIVEAPTRPVTMRDIAEQCGVTTATVSLALRQDPRLSAATIERVQTVATTLGYDRAHNQAARRMVMRRYGRDVINQMVAIFLPRYFYKATYFASLAEGVMDALAEHNFTNVIVYSDTATLDDRPLPPIFTNSEVDGAIIYGNTQVYHKLRQTSGFHQRPILSMIVPVEGCPIVAVDDEHGAYLAAKHLLELGHRRFLHWYTPDPGVSGARLTGTQRALREWQLDPDEHLTLATWYLGSLNPPFHLALPDGSADDAAHGFSPDAQHDFLAYLRIHPDITAILAPNDATARRVGYLLRREGWKIPDDISLVGYDDCDPMPDEHGHNILTSVHLPLVDVGRHAGYQLIQQIMQGTPLPQRLILPTVLHVRQSTAVPHR